MNMGSEVDPSWAQRHVVLKQINLRLQIDAEGPEF